MSVLYGASVWQEKANPSNYRYDTLVKDSEVIAVGDPLTLSSGVLSVTTGTTTIIGVSGRALTAAQVGATNDTVYCPYVPVSDDTIFLMGTDSDLTDNETDGGTYYTLTATGTGLIQVAVAHGVATTTSRVVEIVKVDPRGIGGSGSGSGLREVLVRFIKTPYTNSVTT